MGILDLRILYHRGKFTGFSTLCSLFATIRSSPNADEVLNSAGVTNTLEGSENTQLGLNLWVSKCEMAEERTVNIREVPGGGGGVGRIRCR